MSGFVPSTPLYLHAIHSKFNTGVTFHTPVFLGDLYMNIPLASCWCKLVFILSQVLLSLLSHLRRAGWMKCETNPDDHGAVCKILPHLVFTKKCNHTKSRIIVHTVRLTN